MFEGARREGEAIGEVRGEARGRAACLKEGKLSAALNMKNLRMATDVIMQVPGLSAEEIEKLWLVIWSGELRSAEERDTPSEKKLWTVNLWRLRQLPHQRIHLDGAILMAMRMSQQLLQVRSFYFTF